MQSWPVTIALLTLPSPGAVWWGARRWGGWCERSWGKTIAECGLRNFDGRRGDISVEGTKERIHYYYMDWIRLLTGRNLVTTYEIIGVAGVLITFAIIGVTAWLVVRSMK